MSNPAFFQRLFDFLIHELGRVLDEARQQPAAPEQEPEPQQEAAKEPPAKPPSVLDAVHRMTAALATGGSHGPLTLDLDKGSYERLWDELLDMSRFDTDYRATGYQKVTIRSHVGLVTVTCTALGVGGITTGEAGPGHD